MDENYIGEIANRFVEDYRQFASILGTHDRTSIPQVSLCFYYNQDFVVFGKPIKQWADEYNSSTLSKITSGGFFDYRSSLHWKSRRLFTTIAGRVGLGGNSCRSGDLVCILLGCPTSLILRQNGVTFQLIGEAYVHGLMDGEAMKGVEAGEYSMRDFGII